MHTHGNMLEQAVQFFLILNLFLSHSLHYFEFSLLNDAHTCACFSSLFRWSLFSCFFFWRGIIAAFHLFCLITNFNFRSAYFILSVCLCIIIFLVLIFFMKSLALIAVITLRCVFVCSTAKVLNIG